MLGSGVAPLLPDPGARSHKSPGSDSRHLGLYDAEGIHQDAAALSYDVTAWREYRLDWTTGEVHFQLDSKTVFSTQVSPLGPLGLVLWVDNQYTALPPAGRLRYGTLPNPHPAWIELAGLSLTSPRM